MGQHPELDFLSPPPCAPTEWFHVVLGRMRRRWPVERIIECVGQVRAVPGPAGIDERRHRWGFPGENGRDFQATCQAVEAAGFSKLHIFRFSPRQGTEAARMPDRVPADIQQDRAAVGRIGPPPAVGLFPSPAGRRLQVLVGKLCPVEARNANEETTYVTGLRFGLRPILPAIGTPPGRQSAGHVGPLCAVELPGRPEQIGRLVWARAGRVAGERIQAQ